MKKPKPENPQPAAGPTSPGIPTSAQDMWLAGLDAFSQATKAATEAATQAATQAASQVASMAAGATAPPSLEGLFEARVAKALARLGTPSRAEMEALSAQVEDLRAALQAAMKELKALKGSKPLKAKSPVKRP